jgi:hypothetical protein
LEGWVSWFARQETDKTRFSFDPHDFVSPWNITEHDERAERIA